MELSHRDRILGAIRHQPIDRLPTDIWATPEVMQRLYNHFQVDNNVDLFDCLGIDGIFGITPPYIGPETPVEDGYRVDEWGMGYRMQVYPTGVYEEQVTYPLAQASSVEDLKRFRWPSPDWYDYSALAAMAEKYPDRAISCGYTAIFYWHNRLRGLEQSLMDPLAEPEITRYLVDRVTEFFLEYHRRCYEAAKGKIDITQVTDDFGSQNGLLISPKVFDTYYRGGMQQAIDLAKSFGILVFHHDDGDNRRLLPQLAQMGIDVLNPIQWRCGNWDLDALKTEFGGQICFHGGVDNQETLPFKRPEDVREEVRWLKQTLGKDGTGYIIAPCHNIQPNTSIENIIALYQTAVETTPGSNM